jgi:hypothetical protein
LPVFAPCCEFARCQDSYAVEKNGRPSKPAHEFQTRLQHFIQGAIGRLGKKERALDIPPNFAMRAFTQP